jgi:hypothetical protein
MNNEVSDLAPSGRQNSSTKLVAPASGRRPVELAHQLTVRGVNKDCRLRAVDRLAEGVVDEVVLDIKLVHGPTPGDIQCQHSPEGGGLHDGVEGVIIVYPEALGEPLENSVSLVPVHRVIHLEFVLEDPLDSHIGSGRLADQSPTCCWIVGPHTPS